MIVNSLAPQARKNEFKETFLELGNILFGEQATEDWEADPPLTRDMRAIFNEIMNMVIPESERTLFRSES